MEFKIEKTPYGLENDRMSLHVNRQLKSDLLRMDYLWIDIDRY